MTRTASLLLLSLTLCSCGQAELQSGIDATGGTIRSADGRIALEIPPGALSQRTLISIRELENGSLPSGALKNTGFELLPDGLTFAKPVKLTLTYSGEALPGADATWLRVVQVLEDGSIALTEAATDQPRSGVLSAMLHHFSKYAIADLKLADATVTTTKKKITDVDVLFVVDNSNSMEEEQAHLAMNFPRFIQKLEQAQLSYRIGVISTDLGAGSFSIPTCEGSDGGKLRTKPSPSAPGCPMPTDPWIERKPGGVSNVPGGNVTAAFSCMARMGVGGCGFEQPLESMHRALDPTLAVNPGFLRPDAALVVVVISDEDDCSAKDTSLFDPTQQSLTSPLGPLTSFRCTEFGITCDVNGRTPGPRQGCKPSTGSYLHELQRYMDLLGTLKPGGSVILSVIAGPATPVEVGMDGISPSLKPSCSSANGHAAPAVRLTSLAQAFGKRGALTSVCDSDYGPALDMVGSLVTEQIQVTWCMPDEPADQDPKTPELEGACLVVASKAGQLQACKPGQQLPCYRLEKSATCKKSSTTISVENVAPADLGDEVQVVCLGVKP